MSQTRWAAVSSPGKIGHERCPSLLSAIFNKGCCLVIAVTPCFRLWGFWFCWRHSLGNGIRIYPEAFNCFLSWSFGISDSLGRWHYRQTGIPMHSRCLPLRRLCHNHQAKWFQHPAVNIRSVVYYRNILAAIAALNACLDFVQRPAYFRGASIPYKRILMLVFWPSSAADCVPVDNFTTFASNDDWAARVAAGKRTINVGKSNFFNRVIRSPELDGS